MNKIIVKDLPAKTISEKIELLVYRHEFKHKDIYTFIHMEKRTYYRKKKTGFKHPIEIINIRSFFTHHGIDPCF